MTNDEILKICVEQEEKLKFKSFSRQDALNIGLAIIEYSKARNYVLAVEITVNNHQIFKYALDGATTYNDIWMEAKRNTVNVEQKSSYRVAREYEKEGKTPDQKRMPPEKYAICGGGFPINIIGTGVVGSICVSGMPDHIDHQIMVDVLTEYLK